MHRLPRRVSHYFARPVRNFGDLLGPMIVSLLLAQKGWRPTAVPARRLLTRGVDCLEIFGDPALLLPSVRPDLTLLAEDKRHRVTFIPHIDDPWRQERHGLHSISPRVNVENVLRTVVQSEFVVATSLHAVIVGEAFGGRQRSVASAALKVALGRMTAVVLDGSGW